jgi:ADP-dependent NAD(P)H-hydrate dehydratase
VPPDTASRANPIEVDDEGLRRWPLPLPAEGGGKEERGQVLIVGGTREVPGAVVLAATAALRAGAGKVTVATVRSVASALSIAVPESRVVALDETPSGNIALHAVEALNAVTRKADALLIGPGLLNESASWDLTAALLDLFPRSHVILDAGAMGVAGIRRGKPMRFSGSVLLTPHAGEMAGLTGENKDDVEADPRRACLDAARAWQAMVALKGSVTHIAAPDGREWRHEGGNIGLGTSGSGDVLSGLIVGLLARGATLEQAGAWGVALHARAGERLARRVGLLGYLAREIAAEVPALMDALAGR